MPLTLSVVMVESERDVTAINNEENTLDSLSLNVYCYFLKKPNVVVKMKFGKYKTDTNITEELSEFKN